MAEQCDNCEEWEKNTNDVREALMQLSIQGYGEHRWFVHINNAYEKLPEKPKSADVATATIEPKETQTDAPKLKELMTQNRLLTSQLQHCESIISDMKLHQAILENQKNTATMYADSLQQLVNNLNGNTPPKSLKQATNRVTLAMRLGYAKGSKYKPTSVGVDEI